MTLNEPHVGWFLDHVCVVRIGRLSDWVYEWFNSFVLHQILVHLVGQG